VWPTHWGSRSRIEEKDERKRSTGRFVKEKN
jgi:hypothetical protein